MIGLFTPYRRCDITDAALCLADVILAMGEDIKVIAYDKHESNVHPFWDKYVLFDKRNTIYLAAKKCQTFIHFSHNQYIFDMTKLVAEEARQILVLSQILYLSDNTVRNDINYGIFKYYDSVILPNEYSRNKLLEKKRVKNSSWSLWPSGLPSIRKEGLVQANKLNICIYCDINAIKYNSELLIELCHYLLCDLPKLHIGLLIAKSLSPSNKIKLKKIFEIYPTRIKIEKLTNLQSQVMILHNYDWFVCLSISTDFGMIVSKALSCGMPVIANDTPPFNELLKNNLNGQLVNCGKSINHIQEWHKVCMNAFSDNRLLFNMQRRSWSLKNFQKSFNSYWSGILNL